MSGGGAYAVEAAGPGTAPIAILMASPQKEDGHLDVANELAEALTLAPLSGAQFRLLWFVLRKTYGWNKKTDVISVGQFAEATGLHRKVVERELRELTSRHYLLARGDNHHPKTFGIQKDYDRWDAGEVGTKMLTLRARRVSDPVPTPGESGNQNAPKWEPNGSKVGTKMLTTITTLANTTPQIPGETEPHGSAASGPLRERFEVKYRESRNKPAVLGELFSILLGQEPDFGRLGGMSKRLNSGGRLMDFMIEASKARISDDPHDYLERLVQRELGKERGDGHDGHRAGGGAGSGAAGPRRGGAAARPGATGGHRTYRDDDLWTQDFRPKE